MALSQASELATILGVFVALFGLVHAYIQIRKTAQIAEGQFLLELTKMFKEHDEVHLNLRPGGKWADERRTPYTQEEWAAVDAYMGLFERCEILIKQDSLDPNIFANLFAYRIENLLAQDAIIAEKLGRDERDNWTDFINLIYRLGRMSKLREESLKRVHLIVNKSS